MFAHAVGLTLQIFRGQVDAKKIPHLLTRVNGEIPPSEVNPSQDWKAEPVQRYSRIFVSGCGGRTGDEPKQVQLSSGPWKSVACIEQLKKSVTWRVPIRRFF